MTMEQESPLKDGSTPEYITTLLEFLGDREPLAVFAETEEKLRAATAGLSDELLRAPEPPGKWSVLEVVCHLADVDIVLGFRYRMAVAQPGKPVAAIDQDAWVSKLDSNGRSLSEALDNFSAVRGVNLRFLQGLSEEAFERYAIHEQRGKETLGDMVRLYAAHDLYHLYQIDRIKTAIGV